VYQHHARRAYRSSASTASADMQVSVQAHRLVQVRCAVRKVGGVNYCLKGTCADYRTVSFALRRGLKADVQFGFILNQRVETLGQTGEVDSAAVRWETSSSSPVPGVTISPDFDQFAAQRVH